jgi:hypothetical protein
MQYLLPFQKQEATQDRPKQPDTQGPSHILLEGVRMKGKQRNNATSLNEVLGGFVKV